MSLPGKRLYLDVCALCRPLDDQEQMRIRLETGAVHLILRSVQDGRFGLVVSPAHRVEIEAIQEDRERIELLSLLNRYGAEPAFDLVEARARAEQLHSLRFGLVDAAHLAFAEQSADFFVTCDDRLLKKCRRIELAVSVLNPLELCLREELH